jgi:hypothetical protein
MSSATTFAIEQSSSNPDRATRRAEEEGGDMLFVPSDDEVGAFRAAIRAERAEGAIKHSELGERGNQTGSRAAVLWRSAQTTLFRLRTTTK